MEDALDMPGRRTKPAGGAPSLAVLGALSLRDAVDAVAVVGTDGKVAAVNPAFARALGRPDPELVGRRLDTLFRVTDGEDIGRIVDGVLGGTSWRGDLCRPDAEPDAGVWDAALSPVGADGHGRALAVMAVLRDVRERYEAEERRVDFLSMVTHDIKGPLTVILGYAELLADPDEVPSHPMLLDILGRIRESGEQIHALVSNFIEMSRIEAGRLVLEKVPVDVTEIVDGVVARHASRAERKGIEVTSAFVPLPVITGDRPHLERAVLNLLGNAIKFTPKGGRITVSTRLEGDRVAIAVADTGPGIPPEDLGDIFEKYRRAPAAGRVEGTGLGLFIAHTVVQGHQGEIRVETAVDAGSTFTILLPVSS